jgi:DNA-binding PadR family transcriptional regulator
VGVLDAPKGLAIKNHLAACYPETVRHPRLYGNLDQLVEAGLLAKGEQDGRTNYYELTERGVAVLHERDELLQGGVSR